MINTPKKSWYMRIFGRSLVSVLFGTFFENKNNTASIIAILLVITLCYTVIFKEKYGYVQGILNIVFVVIGYYFGAKQGHSEPEE